MKTKEQIKVTTRNVIDTLQNMRYANFDYSLVLEFGVLDIVLTTDGDRLARIALSLLYEGVESTLEGSGTLEYIEVEYDSVCFTDTKSKKGVDYIVNELIKELK